MMITKKMCDFKTRSLRDETEWGEIWNLSSWTKLLTPPNALQHN